MKKAIITSLVAVALCLSLIVGSTFALFTSEANVSIAVTSGKVSVTAAVTDMQVSSNTESDAFNWTPSADIGDGSKQGTFVPGGTATYVPGDGAGALTLANVIPGDAVKLSVALTNDSNVRIKYQVRIMAESDTFDGAAAGEEDPNPKATLSSALELIYGGETHKGVTYAASAWSAAEPSDDIAAEEVILRLPKDVDNDYQYKSCQISLTVIAIQGNAQETTYCEEHGHNIVDDVCTRCGFENPFKADGLNEVDGSGNYIVKGAPQE